jgi:hypothetical protein
VGGHQRVPGVATGRPRHGGASRALAGRGLFALQRSAGNAAVGTLLRQVGWPGAGARDPNHGPSSADGVDRYPLWDAALGGASADAKHPEGRGHGVIVLVPTQIDRTRPAQVLLHFHGLDPGYVGGDGSVRDEDPDRDRSDAQLAARSADGDRQMVVIMPQGGVKADFGTASSDPHGYVDRALALLKADTGVAVTPGDLVVGGWSAGGNHAARIAAAEAAAHTPTMTSLFLFDGVNNFLATEEVDDDRHPGKKKTIEHDWLASRDKLDTFLGLVARRLAQDVTALSGADAATAAHYLDHSFRFLAYYNSAGLYAPV